MQIKAYLFSKKKNFFLNIFLCTYNFKFINIKELKELSEPSWIFYGSDLDQNDTEIFLRETKGLKIPIIFCIPRFLKDMQIKEGDNKLIYPLNVTSFERFVLNSGLIKTFKYEDIIIDSSNLVKNRNNNLSVYFTEKEADLFKNLVNFKKIKKQKIKTEILKFNSLLQTRSLESHLSRIRKKIRNIKLDVEILSSEKNFIKII